MPGGAAAVRNPLRMAYGVLYEFDLLEHPGAADALLALGEQAKEAQRRHDEDQEAQRRLRERCIELEETATRLQAEVAAREQRIGALEQEAEEKEKELAQEAESSTELLTALGDSTHVGLGRGGES